jgi:antitoxin component of MazEF toxin-antitoxin module
MRQIQAVRRWGTSRAVVITRRVQSQVSWPLREVVHVSVEDDAIVLRPVTITVGAPKSTATPVSERLA